ncbi:MAG TPA: hypothetical protein VHO50_11055 [Bacteroidales bacterium]|nr:hypothetical protein [Bacteroidales bacterium]
METGTVNIKDRVRENTPENRNIKMDAALMERLKKYRNLSIYEINLRLKKLEKEWDIERALEVNASSLAISGIVLGTIVSRKWFLLSFFVSVFLLHHGVQGWCPPIPVLRAFGYRTRQEINEEIYALKAIRGDFDNISSTSEPFDLLASLRR